MDDFAAGIIREREAELLKWLRWRLCETEQAKRAAVQKKDYGEAQFCEGIAQAYAFTILHFERTMLPKKKRR
jgi:hypothetical protein